MTQAAVSRTARVPVSGALAALCMLLLAACSDGCPTEDVPYVDPARMTQSELLTELNALGARPHLGKHWRYALDANCGLEVRVRSGHSDRRLVALEGAEVTTRSEAGVIEILVVPKAAGNAQPVIVLETRCWSDTVRARSLFTHLESRCRSAEDPTP